MTTSADQELDYASDYLDKAVKHLSNIAIYCVSGTFDIRAEKRHKLREIFYQLVRLRDELNEE